ncbi:MAG: PRD domain-containing protein [Coriobacteriia bacterium]|nr:PRD domain-containing protein [Coriobacteriia bacterium]
MRVAKRINNNAVMCVDSKGRSVVAFGKGIAFAIDKETGELPLSAIERTFYNVDEHYLALLEELSPAVLAVSADVVEAADLELPYELSHNAVLALADHITFAIQRERKGIVIQMPLAYDVAQMYPVEYRVGEYAVGQISRKLGVDLPKCEVVGVALCLVNASLTPEDAAASADQAATDNDVIEKIARIVEDVYAISVDRDGFEFARFATHMHYLIGRIRQGESMYTDGSELYGEVRAQSERGAACLDRVVELLSDTFGENITDSEKLYVLMHILRISHPRV